MTAISIPRISKVSGWAVGASWAAFFPGALVFLDYSVLKSGLPGPEHPAHWTWLALVLWNVGYVAATLYVTPLMLGPFLVSLFPAGLEAVTLWGVRRLSWASIDDVRGGGARIVLRAGRTRVVLNEYCYVDPHSLRPFLATVLPPSLRSPVAV